MLMRLLRSRPVRTDFRYRTMPEINTLETRLVLSLARPSVRAAAADMIAFRGSTTTGVLDIQGTSRADTVEIGRSARGFVTLTIDGVVRSGDLRDRDAFDRRLSGLRVDQIRSVRLIGNDPLDTVVLNTMLGTSARPARIQSSAVAIAAPVSQAGTLRIDARSITVSAAVRADSIVLSVSGLLNLEAGGALTATKSIDLKADRLIQTGNLTAPAVSMAANVLIRSGTITASGGAVNVDFTTNYVSTEGAAIDVSASSGKGGSIRIDGGATGHLFNSGTLRATGKTDGGAVRVSGKDVVWIGGGADASGGASGGLIQVGGGWQGSDASMTKARTLQVSPHTSLRADGAAQGGTVVLWSEEETTNYGTVSTKGAKGGAVEVSSKLSLAHSGSVDVGAGGKFLLDPKNVVIADNVMGGVPMFELVNPTPNVNDNFGVYIVPLTTGNVVVTDHSDDAVANNAGAVYLYNGATGALIATLTGSTASDAVGGNGVTALTNGNYVVVSYNWDNGSNANAGAVTWGSGTSGVAGAVSATNSLVGSTANDQVGIGGVTALSNGNYVVVSSLWNRNSTIDAGAVTWGSGTSGIAGAVATANSLVGSTANDQVGANGVTGLSSGNYVVNSPNWDNGAATDAGAVTWGSGTAGVKGAVSSSNSLVGSTASDQVGVTGVTELANGNYVVRTSTWDNGATTNAGAVTWSSGTAGVTGVVTASNSLVGSTANDQLGLNDVTALVNGNYVVRTPSWDNGALTNAGAVTWGSGTAGAKGVVSSSNSLVGSTANDRVGSNGVTALSNGNYVVISPNWDNGATTDAGAVTLGSGNSGVAGPVSATNSLVGTRASDQVGSNGVTALSNGNYVVISPNWDSGAVTDAGAVTLVPGNSGVTGAVTSSNSLVGSTASDQVGSNGVTALSNGNYVVISPNWDVPGKTDVGAVTWCPGTSGVTGAVSVNNSFAGTTISDQVGSNGVTALADGNYVVISPNWDGAGTDVGAVTWGSGTSGVFGTVDPSNSIFGNQINAQVGSNGVTALANGNFVVISPNWNDGLPTNLGAVTWGSGTTVTGPVSSTNSLVGTRANDQVGSNGVTALANGNYVVSSPNWDNGATTDVGAVTWGSGTSGKNGAVSSANSLIGSTANDQVGSGGLASFSNGISLVSSPLWDNGASADAGAVTSMNNATGEILTGLTGGAVSLTNSIVGIGTNIPVEDSVNGTYLVRRTTSGGAVFVNLQTPVPAGVTFAASTASSANMSPAFVATPLIAGTATKLQANNDITLSNDMTVDNPSGNGGALTLQAGRSVTFNAKLLTDGGNLIVLANADLIAGVVNAQRDAGAGGVNIPFGTLIDADSGTVSLASGAATGLTNRTSGGVTVSGTVRAKSVTITTADSGSGTPSVNLNGIMNLSSTLTIQSDGPVNFGATAEMNGMTSSSITTSNDAVSFAGSFAQPGNWQINAGTGLVSFADDWMIGSGSAFVSSTQAVTVADVLSLSRGTVIATAGLSVGDTGTVRGNGNIVSQIALGTSVTISPSAGAASRIPGTLNFGQALTLPATSTVAMNGTSKTAFDKIVVTGVDLAGATLSLDLSEATLAVGDSITLVDNVSDSAVTGTFAGLAQGAIFTADGHTMQITYTGGDGNDVTVTKVADITASFSINRSGFMYVDEYDAYWQSITLTNTSLTVKKPRTLKFVGLPDRVSVLDGTKIGSDWFLNVGEPSVSPTGSVGLPVYFQVTSGGAFAYSLEVIGG